MAAAYVLCQMSPQSESPWVGAKSSKHAGEATCREPFCARKLTMRWSALPVGRGTRWHALMMDTVMQSLSIGSEAHHEVIGIVSAAMLLAVLNQASLPANLGGNVVVWQPSSRKQGNLLPTGNGIHGVNGGDACNGDKAPLLKCLYCWAGASAATQVHWRCVH